MAQSAELMKSYNQFQALRKAGKYREAEPHAKRALELGRNANLARSTRLMPPSSTILPCSIMRRGATLTPNSSISAASPSGKKTLGRDHSLVGASLNNLAELNRAQGRYSEAETAL